MDQDILLINLLASGLAHCRAVVVEHSGLMSSLLVAGLVGSASHCAGMYGPFVLAQSVSRLEALPAAEMREFHRLAGGALVPYHLGRMTAYAGLGAAAGALAGGVIDLTGLRWLSAVPLGLAALFFLGYAVRRLGGLLPWLSAGGEGWWSRTIAAAAAAGDALTGALAMIAFALGTVPALVAVGLAGHVAGRQWQTLAARVTPVLLAANAAALSYLAWRMIG